MLLLRVRLGGDQFVLDTAQVEEVLPLVRWAAVPGAPAGIAGVLNYHGAAVPLLDLSELITGTRSERRMTTRIIVARYGANGTQQRIAMIAEDLTDAVRRPDSALTDGPMRSASAPFLGRISTDSGEIVQEIDISKLLSDETRTAWFG
jgi:chemotaxis-related protein WspB